MPNENNYNETIHYDRNGNIHDLQRNGEIDDDLVTFQIDDLTYDYDSDLPNRLLNVSDASHDSHGFKDNNSGSGNDYTYDDNGNLTTDANKGITDISYNHLNLPVKIQFGQFKKIEYLYDASGRKLRKRVTVQAAALDPNATVHTTDYLDGYQYFDGTLEFFGTSEGYVKNTEDGNGHHFNYAYGYTDHLGNVRLTYGLDPTDQQVKGVGRE